MKKTKLWKRILAGGAALVISTGLCFADSKKLAKDLPSDSDALVDVIVQFTVAPTAKHHNKIKQKGGTFKTDLSGIIKGAHYS